jgi:hypothetical protein
LAHRASPRRLQPGGERTRDMRCPSHIGLGRSLHCEPSRLEGACRGARERESTSKAPDPRALGSAVLELPRSNGDVRGEHRGPASGGEPTKVRAPHAKPGIDRPMVVLADRLVGRSRRTTRGPERTGAMSSGERQGLAPSPSRARERRSVGSRARGGKTSTRWRVCVRDSARKRRVEQAFVDGRRLGASEAVPLTRHRGRSLQSAGTRFGARSSTAGRQRKTTLSARGRKRREPEGAARGDLDRVPTRIGQRPRSRHTQAARAARDRQSDEYVLPKLVKRRQAPHDPSCSPEFIFDGRAPPRKWPRTSGFERSSCKCTCQRVGCRSR